MNASALPLATLHLDWVVIFTRRAELLIFSLRGPSGQRLPCGAIVSMN